MGEKVCGRRACIRSCTADSDRGLALFQRCGVVKGGILVVWACACMLACMYVCICGFKGVPGIYWVVRKKHPYSSHSWAAS